MPLRASRRSSTCVDVVALCKERQRKLCKHNAIMVPGKKLPSLLRGIYRFLNTHLVLSLAIISSPEGWFSGPGAPRKVLKMAVIPNNGFWLLGSRARSTRDL